VVHTTAFRVLGASAALLVACACGCMPASTCASQERVTGDSLSLGRNYDSKVLCDKVLAQLLAHGIAVCDREIGPTATERGRIEAFGDIKRDIEGMRGLLDATYAARAIEHFRASKDPVLESMIASGLMECDRQIRSEESSEERRAALIGMRRLIVGLRDLLKKYYSTAGLLWPEDNVTSKG